MENNKNRTLNCTGPDADREECKVIDEKLLRHFKIMIVIIFVLLLIFLGFFVYNLIKCYLPKWRKNKLYEETRPVEIKPGNLGPDNNI